ncbi:MAG: dihydropteroate synthase [Anaerolineales bacterium]|nr:dihydropteroate synthase [Anaerolineales bacterium]
MPANRPWLGALPVRRLPMDGRPLIIGILNATPDSFYDGGRYFGIERAIQRAEEMGAEGADIIEVGGETAPLGHRCPPDQSSSRLPANAGVQPPTICSLNVTVARAGRR